MHATRNNTLLKGLRGTCGALLATMTLALASSPSPQPGDQVPFHGAFTTVFDSVVQFPFAHISVSGEGKAQHMGRATAVSTDQLVNLITGETTATYTLTAANGDTVILDMTAVTTFLASGVTFEGSYTVIGGTGRFAHATGSGAVSGSATFTGPTNGFGTFAVDGTISRPGK